MKQSRFTADLTNAQHEAALNDPGEPTPMLDAARIRWDLVALSHRVDLALRTGLMIHRALLSEGAEESPYRGPALALLTELEAALG